MAALNESLEILLGRAVKFRAGLGYPPSGFPLVEANLTPIQQNLVMAKLGTYLATEIHSREGWGFGDIHPIKFLLNGQFQAKYSSWSEFLINKFDDHSRLMLAMKENHEPRFGPLTTLTPEQREQFDYVWGFRPAFRQLLNDSVLLLDDRFSSRLLQGNLHLGNIYVEGNHFKGLADFKQMVLGDPVDDLAYFSVMPGGNSLLPSLKYSWQEHFSEPDFDEKFHLYRLWQAYRKISTRYLNHKNLDQYPEPLEIAERELDEFGI